MSVYLKVVAAVFLTTMVASLASAQDWTLASASTHDWSCLASTADGGRLFGAGDGNIYISTNFGSTWTLTGAPLRDWSSMACSADGSIITALTGGGSGPGFGLYVSTNYGAAWTLAFSPSNHWWNSVVCSSHGKRMAAASGYGQFWPTNAIYISTNCGGDWIRTSAPDGSGQLAMSADGSRLAIAAGGALEVSTNFGLTWLATYPSGYPTFVTTSGAGTTLIAISFGSISFGSSALISTSSDWGATWRSLRSLTNELDSVCAACSADGVTLAAVETSQLNGINHLLLSTNSGTSWSIMNLLWATNHCAMVSSADGSRVAAAFAAGYQPPGVVYVREATPVPRLMVLSGLGSLELTWLVPSEPFALEESSDLLTWSQVAANPALNYTNLYYEVKVPVPIAPRFYRLASR